jgi:predicted nucleic acid-binding Zn ribbon protein
LRFPQRINKIIPRVMLNMGIKDRMKNWQIVEKWPEIVGTRVAKHATATHADAENLFVEVDNPVWQSQLFLMKEEIIKKIRVYNRNIKDIKFRIIESNRKKGEKE